MTQKFDEGFALSIDLAAFVKDQLCAAADVASGRITPAEGRRLVTEGSKTIQAAEAALKLGMSAARKAS